LIAKLLGGFLIFSAALCIALAFSIYADCIDPSSNAVISTPLASTLDYPISKDLYIPGSYDKRSFYYDKNHLGEDEKMPEGSEIRAIGNGKLVFYGSQLDPNTGKPIGYGELYAVIENDLGREVSFTNAYGNVVKTRFILSIYGHIRKNKNRGDGNQLPWILRNCIKKGDVIGYVNDDADNGDGKEHIHLGIRLSDDATALRADGGKRYRGYEINVSDNSNSGMGKDFAAASQVIPIVNNSVLSLLLNHGWNMVSPVGGSMSLDLYNKLLSADFCVRTNSVWWWDPSQVNYIKNPTNLDPEKGYWIYISNANGCTVHVPIGSLTQKSASFSNGWNMISPVSQNISRTDFLSKNCQFHGGPWWYDAVQNAYILPTTLEPSKGYWINVLDNPNCATTLFLPLSSEQPPTPPGDGSGNGGAKNNPPTTPTNPSPANAATNTSLTPSLTWTGGDPDGDPVTFDVYFGTTNPPSFQSTQSDTSYNPSNSRSLNAFTTYYWKIVAKDGKGGTTAGPVWKFRTQTAAQGAPTVTTGAASDLTSSGVTLNGTLNPNNLYTTAYFEYGTTTTYGKRTPNISLTASNISSPVSTKLTGLVPQTSYHFRLVGYNSKGTSNGLDVVFTAQDRSNAVDCALAVTPTSSSLLEASGGISSITVSTTSSCSWSVTSNPSWVTITSGLIGTGNGTVSYTVPANLNASSRSENITISTGSVNKNYLVQQLGISYPASTNFAGGQDVVTISPLDIRSKPGRLAAISHHENSDSAGRVSNQSPVVLDGITWWNVTYDDGVGGWSEGSGIQSYSRPLSLYSPGSRVKALAMLTVRSGPCLSCSLAGSSVHSGTMGTILNYSSPLPRHVDGHDWWPIGWDNGVAGWSAGSFLSGASVTLSLTPTRFGNAFQIKGVTSANQNLQLTVFDAKGDLVFQSGWAAGSYLWRGQDNSGRRLANGVYLYVITLKTSEGRIISTEVKKIMVLRK
jgi:hypothetical protein